MFQLYITAFGSHWCFTRSRFCSHRVFALAFDNAVYNYISGILTPHLIDDRGFKHALLPLYIPDDFYSHACSSRDATLA